MAIGADIVRYIGSLETAVDTPMEYYGIAVDRVRFVGESVAVVCALDRCAAGDAPDDTQAMRRQKPGKLPLTMPPASDEAFLD